MNRRRRPALVRRLLMLAAAAAWLGACDSSGCGAPDDKPRGEPTSLPSGAGGHGGLGEAVSFQGTGKKKDPPPAQAAQRVICGGFPDLQADCSRDPRFDSIKKKCCPDGQVESCSAIPGGARLTGQGCTTASK